MPPILRARSRSAALHRVDDMGSSGRRYDAKGWLRPSYLRGDVATNQPACLAAFLLVDHLWMSLRIICVLVCALGTLLYFARPQGDSTAAAVRLVECALLYLFLWESRPSRMSSTALARRDRFCICVQITGWTDAVVVCPPCSTRDTI